MLYVLKLGGSVITDKDGYAAAKLDVIERLTKEIADAKKTDTFQLVLVNGAGSFGHAPVKKYGIRDGIKKPEHVMGVVAVHKHVEDLNRKMWEFLNGFGIAAAPVHPMSFILASDGKFEVDTKIIEAMLEREIVPMLYGDMVMDTRRGAAIISGDDLAPMLGAALNADRIMMGTNTNGIYDRDPLFSKDAKHVKEINDKNWSDVLNQVGGSAAQDVTGGMKEKLRKLVTLSEGIECLIYDAEVPGNTQRVLAGELLGTRISVRQAPKAKA